MLLLESDWQFQKILTSKVRNLPLNARLPFLWRKSGYETNNKTRRISHAICVLYHEDPLPTNINRKELYDFYYTAITLTTGYKLLYIYTCSGVGTGGPVPPNNPTMCSLRN